MNIKHTHKPDDLIYYEYHGPLKGKKKNKNVSSQKGTYKKVGQQNVSTHKERKKKKSVLNSKVSYITPFPPQL